MERRGGKAEEAQDGIAKENEEQEHGKRDAALAQQPPRSPCVRIEYDVATQCVRDRDGSGPQPAAEERSEVKVVLTLSARAVAWQSEGDLSTWDFEAGVSRTIDRAAGSYSEVSLLHEAAWQLDEGHPAESLAAAALAEAIEASTFVGPNALQIFGGHGFMQDYPVEKHMREARALGLLLGGFDAAREDAGEHLCAAGAPVTLSLGER